MFSEELRGNAQRRRQEEARERRRRTKSRQTSSVPKSKTTKTTTTTTTTVPASSSSAAAAKSDVSKDDGASKSVVAPVVVAPTAAEVAEIHREARRLERVRRDAAVVLQKHHRGRARRRAVGASVRASADRRLSDLVALTSMLPADYVPPPATVTSLTAERRVAAELDPDVPPDWRLDDLLTCAVTPSLRSADPHARATDVWVQTAAGRGRLSSLTRACLDSGSDAARTFLRELYRDRGASRAFARTLLTERIDVVGRAGRVLSGVPVRAVAERDARRYRACFDAALDVAAGGGDDRSRARFVTEVLAVPLLDLKTDPTRLIKRDDGPRARSLLESFLDAAVRVHGARLVDALTRVDLAVVPAPPVLCLLDNLWRLGDADPRLCDDPVAAARYHDVLASLAHRAPLGALRSSASSAVEWIGDRPVVLSPLLVERCRALTGTDRVREAYAATRDDARDAETRRVLNLRTKTDEERETETAGSARASAVKEATAKGPRGEWFTTTWAKRSGWATKLKKSVSDMFSSSADGGGDDAAAVRKGRGRLVDTSAVSRGLAKGTARAKRDAPKTATNASLPPSSSSSSPPRPPKQHRDTLPLLLSLCRLHAVVLARWGGGGGRGPDDREAAERTEPCARNLANALCFSTNLLETSWAALQAERGPTRDRFRRLTTTTDGDDALRSLAASPREVADDAAVLLFLFLSTLSHTLLITDDAELHEMEKPIPKHQLRRVVDAVKGLADKDLSSDGGGSSYFSRALLSSARRTLRDLHDRSSRRPLCHPKRFAAPDAAFRAALSRCRSHADHVALLRTDPLLRARPHAVPFRRRLDLFHGVVSSSRREIQGENDLSNGAVPLRPGVRVSVCRGRVLEDGLRALRALGPGALRRRLVVEYVNEAGAREAGVDAGGLLKEFWGDLCAQAFDPNFGLFRTTDHDDDGGGGAGYLYPNPSSSSAHGEAHHATLFEFLGRVLGKALYEGITVRPQFAHLFLSFMRGDYNFMHMLSDLSTLDPVLYNNLMFLKTYEGDASDLCLTFTVTNEDFGETKEVPLIPNGANVDVTNSNKQRYISLVAKHHVYDRLRVQSEAFTRGLHDVVDPAWLRIFNEPELQVLISGSSPGRLDLDDMRSHTRYAGGFSGLDRHVHRFWRVVESLDDGQQAALLRFVSGCERPPAAGFRNMNPPFTLQRVPVSNDGDRLPTASTCFNVLKLPTYSSEKVLRQRLIYSITSGSGFELS